MGRGKDSGGDRERMGQGKEGGRREGREWRERS